MSRDIETLFEELENITYGNIVNEYVTDLKNICIDREQKTNELIEAVIEYCTNTVMHAKSDHLRMNLHRITRLLDKAKELKGE